MKRFAILAKSCLTCQAYDELDKISCPVYIIGGSRDKVVGENASREITDKLQEHFSHLINVEYTANMETDLDKIADGKENYVEIRRCKARYNTGSRNGYSGILFKKICKYNS